MPNLRNIIIITKTILNHEYEHIKGIKGIFTMQAGEILVILFYLLLYYFYTFSDFFAYKYLVTQGFLEILYLCVLAQSVDGMYNSSFFVNDHVIYCQDRINKLENYKTIELLLSNILSCAIIFIIRVLPIITLLLLVIFNMSNIDIYLILVIFILIIWSISSNILYTSLDFLMLVYKQKILMSIKYLFLFFNIFYNMLMFFIIDILNKNLIISFTPVMYMYTFLCITILSNLFLSSILFFLSSQKLQQKILLSKK